MWFVLTEQFILERIRGCYICGVIPLLCRVSHCVSATPRMVPRTGRAWIPRHRHWYSPRCILRTLSPQIPHCEASTRPDHRQDPTRGPSATNMHWRHTDPDWRVLVFVDCPATRPLDIMHTSGCAIWIGEWACLHLCHELSGG